MMTWARVRGRMQLLGQRCGARLWRGEEGIGTLEMVLIAAILIIVALIFKKWIVEFVSDLMGKAESKAGTIFD